MIKEKIEDIELIWNMLGRSRSDINNQQIRFFDFKIRVLKEVDLAKEKAEKEIFEKYSEQLNKFEYFAKCGIEKSIVDTIGYNPTRYIKNPIKVKSQIVKNYISNKF